MSEKMVVNAAIEALLKNESENWLVHARPIVAFGRQLDGRPGVYSQQTEESDGGTSTSGFAAGIGTVSTKDERRVVKQTETSGFQVERVGYYKLWHSTRNKEVKFWHFKQDALWKGDDHILTNNGDGFCLFYDETGEPHTFAAPIWEEVFASLSRLIGICEEFFMNLYSHVSGKGETYKYKRTFRICRSYHIIRSTRPGYKEGAVVTGYPK